MVLHQRKACEQAALHAQAKKIATGAISYLDYLRDTWMPIELWKSWSRYGREAAAERMGVTADEVLNTTNHLEALNGSLKRKYIPQWQHSGHRLRFDILIFHTISSILPRIYARRRLLSDYHDWKAERFPLVGGEDQSCYVHETASAPTEFTPRVWYELDPIRDSHAQAILNFGKLSILQNSRPYEFWATCQPSSLNTSGEGPPSLYWLSLHPSGVGTCTCADWLTRGGACKHLRAFRDVVRGWAKSGHLAAQQFIFPQTEQEARSIESDNRRWYGEQYLSAVTQPLVATSRPPAIIGAPSALPAQHPPHMQNCPPNTDPALLPPLTHDRVEASLLENEAEMETLVTSPDELPTNGEEATLHRIPSPPVTSIGWAMHGVQTQLQQHIQHDVSKVLPILYGILANLEDPHISLTQHPDLDEFTTVLEHIQRMLPSAMSAGKKPSVDGMWLASEFPAVALTSCTPDAAAPRGRTELPGKVAGMSKPSPKHILPPSPERKQKRKKSRKTL